MFYRGKEKYNSLLPIVSGPAKKVRELMSATCRHSYDGKTLLVPGIPEAENGDAAVDALIKFRCWLKSQNHPGLQF